MQYNNAYNGNWNVVVASNKTLILFFQRSNSSNNLNFSLKGEECIAINIEKFSIFIEMYSSDWKMFLSNFTVYT